MKAIKNYIKSLWSSLSENQFNERFQAMIVAVSSVSYPGFHFNLFLKDGVPYIQIECADTCSITGEPYTWKSRKWLLSYHMTHSEIVQTCFLAAKTAVIHEVHENFKYMDQPIYRPHYNVNELHQLSRVNAVDIRDEPT